MSNEQTTKPDALSGFVTSSENSRAPRATRQLRSQTARTHKPHDWSHPEGCLQKGGTRLISQLHEKWKEEFIQQGQRLFYTSNVIFFLPLVVFPHQPL